MSTRYMKFGTLKNQVSRLGERLPDDADVVIRYENSLRGVTWLQLNRVVANTKKSGDEEFLMIEASFFK